MVINIGEEAHDELAVHAVRHATVAGDRVTKVLDFEGTLEAGSKETTEGSDEGGKGGKDKGMHMQRLKGDGEGSSLGQEKVIGELVGARDENGVDVALEAGEDVGSEIVDGADEKL